MKGFSEKEIRSKQIKVHRATGQINGQITNQRQELVKSKRSTSFIKKIGKEEVTRSAESH
jgi:hypothetical protein